MEDQLASPGADQCPQGDGVQRTEVGVVGLQHQVGPVEQWHQQRDIRVVRHLQPTSSDVGSGGEGIGNRSRWPAPGAAASPGASTVTACVSAAWA
ncbi:hypothetical protein GCM10027605_01780 [Micromonospora zhanjiangensis]